MTSLTALLALLGLYISIYFSLVTYRLVPPSVAWMPQICQLKERACMAIIRNPQARLFGVPNSVLGMAWYLFVLLGALGWVPLGWLLVPSTVTVLTGAYLSYRLIFVARVTCPLCLFSHATNLVLFVIILLHG